MVQSVFSSACSRLLSVATVLTLVVFAASADLQPESALAAPAESANRDDDNNENGNGNRENDNGQDREVDTGSQIASAGNGGVATASADGGVVLIGDVNSGGNAGNAIGVGDTTWGSVIVVGGVVTNATEITVTADGGTAIADASGGNNNFAEVQD